MERSSKAVFRFVPATGLKVLGLCVAISTAGGQSSPPRPLRIAIVEGDSAPPARTGVVAASVRSWLAFFTARDEVRVVSRKDVIDTCDSGCPDRWTPDWLRTIAKVVGADVIVELTTAVKGAEVAAQAVAYRPTSRAADTIHVHGATNDAVANQLSDRLSEMLYGMHEERANRASGAARVVSMPEGNYLLEITRGWSRHSPLGDLRRRSTRDGDVEVRAWAGYGLTGTTGVVLRREGRKWQAWRVSVERCQLSVAIPIADTASAATRATYETRARTRCRGSVGDVSRGATLFEADTLALFPLDVDAATLESAWNATEREGLLALPPKVPRTWMMLDGFTYVIEVRRGAEYRASVIEEVDKPEAPADAQVKRVYQELMRIVPRR